MAPGQSTSIAAEIRRAVQNHATFKSEEVERAVIKSLNDLDADIEEAGMVQSSRSDLNVQALNDAMNEAEVEGQEPESEEEAEETT